MAWCRPNSPAGGGVERNRKAVWRVLKHLSRIRTESGRASAAGGRYAPVMTRRGMTVRTLARFGSGATLAVVVLFGVAVTKAAFAGTLKCEVRFLDADDDMR